ncbi:zinc finger protein 512B isoform X1 [Synchiropus splendidus]|uniref:zinc finger protein 512B isoform X1 n=1 Tax=Synchiropus splendidus TaxID=270530 RepID=UPI00237E57F4|nr:zinc finger protein 512B isoform X1 [Synchiropus splendidus]XP_053706003.1 zinc finger protein 512B isoform X1 [Synchiropus splendidus]XP_053706004.1 zinc finger protein 512B isoform X1 [Synchiropus splendidus]
MENPSSPRLGKLTSSGMPKIRTAKHGHLQDPGSLACTDNNKNSPESDDPTEGKRKGRPKVEVQELRSIPAIMIEQWKEEFKRRSRVKCPCSGCWLEFPSIYGVKYHYQRCQGATVGEKLSHGCPYCEATFATKVRLEKHKLWNHPEQVSLEAKDEQLKFQKKAIKSNSKKRPLEHSPPSPVFFKVKKIHETFTPFHNGELIHHKSERKLPSVNQPHIQQSVQSQSQQSHSASSDAGGSESEGGSLPPLYSDEDPERMKHRRKQKTPKKFTGEQPSISGTFGLKGMTKVEEKLKAGRLKKAEGNLNEAAQKRPAPNQTSKKDQAATSSTGSVTDTLWQKAISERGEVVCPTCSIVTRKTIQGLKNHMEICQKLQDALKCQQCHKQFRSKAGLNYHIMAEHSTKPSGSESQVADEHDERERLRRTLKQMGRIKCPREHSGKNHRSKAERDYHAHTENSAAISSVATVNCKDHVTDTNNNTGKDKVSEVVPSAGKKDQHDRREWHNQQRQHKDREFRGVEQEKKSSESVNEKPVPNAGLQEDFERTPSGRVRRRSAQVAVFHLQEIAEDELAKDWGTKRRNKDDLVPDSKRLNYTRPGLPNFSPELIETWKNQVKEKGFICCTNENCEAVYSSVSGLKAHLANCSQRGGELGKYTCLICQKAFNSESGVKYHISKTHSQNWFRAAASEVVSSSKSKSLEDNGIEPEVRNGATTGKKRGRKPKERRPVVEPLHRLAEESASSQNSSPAMSGSSSPTQMLTDEENSSLNNSLLDRRNKPKKLLLPE